MCQIAKCDGSSVTRSRDYVSARRFGKTVNRRHGNVVMTRIKESFRHSHIINGLFIRI